MFNAIEKNSLPEQIVDYFLDAISSGVFKENDKLLPERDLCEKIGVSRSTLREGLRILELMNVIEKRGDGTFIKIQNDNIIREAISIDFAVAPVNYFELIEVRNLLEVESATSAAGNATPDDVENMTFLCDEMEKHLDDVEEYAVFGTDFHIAIAKATKNDMFYQIFQTIRYTMFDYQKNNMRTKEDVLRSYYAHRELLGAIRERDAVKSGEIMKRHLQYTQDLFEGKN